MILYCVQRQVLRTLVNSNHKSFSCTAILGSKSSLYDDLGLDPTASSKDIKQAFIRLSKEFHPDKNPDNPEAAAKFFEISNAYNVLNNPKTRRSYDRGQLGRLSSVADRESASHQFEKQGFVDSRAQFRERYSKKAGYKDDLDDYVKATSSVNFHRAKFVRDSVGRKTPRAWGSDSANRRSSRTSSQSGFSPNTNDSSGGGGGGFFLILFCPMMFYLVYKVIS